MTKEPEDVLEHEWIPTSSGIKEMCAKVTVRQQHGHCTGQYGHRSQQEKRCDQPRPDKKRHLHQRHARCSHVQDSSDNVDRPENRRHAQDMNRKNREVHSHAGLYRQRGINSPARSRSAAWHKQ